MDHAALALSAALAALCLAGPARANGRFPSASYVIAGPGMSNDRVALSTTFGLVVSTDAGRSWSWLCERAFEGPDNWDPTLAIGERGDVVVALRDGITSSSDFCSFTRAANIGTPLINDLAQSPDGRVILAVYGGFVSPTGLFRSTDGGRTWTRGATLGDGTYETVDIAPSNPNRVYIGGFVGAAQPALFRSDDGGLTVREVNRSFDTVDALVSGVSPTNPDVVYLRTNLASITGGTALVRSSDGGATVTRLTTTAREMMGFALSDDGSTVWVGSANRDEGIRRSVRGGAFERVGPPVSVKCLRQHSGVLYVCGTESTEGWTLASSSNGGESLTPLLSFRTLAGPRSCPSNTAAGMFCPDAWPMTRMLFNVFDGGTGGTDGGLFDVPSLDGASGDDAGTLSDRGATLDRGRDSGARDAALDAPASDTGETTRPEDCSCSVPGVSSTGSRWGRWALGLVVLALGARRRVR